MTELIEVEGLQLECEPIEVEYVENSNLRFKNLKPGDTIVGKRNSGWKIGTVSERLWKHTQENGWMYCDEVSFYPYDVGECMKVVGGLE